MGLNFLSMLSRGFLVQPWFPSCAGTLSSCSSISEFAIANNKVWGRGSATDYKIWRGFLSAASTQVEHFPSRQKSCCFFLTCFFLALAKLCFSPQIMTKIRVFLEANCKIKNNECSSCSTLEYHVVFFWAILPQCSVDHLLSSVTISSAVKHCNTRGGVLFKGNKSHFIIV